MLEILFYVFAAVSIGGAFGVVLQKNPVGSLLFMVMSLASMAGIFVLLEAHFLAAIQILVYAGAIMVLFLFVIMLLNIGHDYRKDIRTGLASMLAFIASGALAGLLAQRLRDADAAPIYRGFDGPEALDAAIREEGIIGVIARPLFTDYVVAFELTGILLLVALVGALVLAKRRA